MNRHQQQEQYCANCSTPLVHMQEDEEVSRTSLKEQQQQMFVEISIQNEPDFHPEPAATTTTTIKVNRVLSSIYKLDYLYKFTDHCEQENIAVCSFCADKLGKLYTIYKEFNDLRRLDSYLTKQLTDLDRLIWSHSNCYHNKSSSNNNNNIAKNEAPHDDNSTKIDDDDNTFDSTTCTSEVEYPLNVCEIESTSTDPIESTNNITKINRPQPILDTRNRGPPWVRLARLTPTEIIEAGASWPPKNKGVKKIRRRKRIMKKPSNTQFDDEDEGQPAEDLSPRNVIFDENDDSDFDPAEDIKEESNTDSDLDDDPSTPTPSRKRKSKTKTLNQKKFKGPQKRSRKIKGDSEDRPYKCQHCDKAYKTSDAYQLHSYSHTDDPKPFKCPLCPEGFITSSKRNRHLSTNHKDEEVPSKNYKCSHDLCQEAFYSAFELDRHVLKCHSDTDVRTPFVCPQCPQRFMYEGSLQGHLNTFHSGETGPGVTCTECGMKVVDRATLKEHMRHMHVYLCSHCGGRFTTEKILKRHVAVRHTNEKPHKCAQCDRTFYTKADLRVHIAYHHSNQKPFECAHCHKLFAVEITMKRHQDLHTTPRRFLCSACGKAFKTKPLLDRHFYLMHMDETRYECSTCGQKFKLSGAMLRHQLIHGEKTKLCPYCGKAFAQTAGLRRHLLTHTGEKPCKCTLCPAAFPDNRPLKKHMLTHHPDEEQARQSQ